MQQSQAAEFLWTYWGVGSAPCMHLYCTLTTRPQPMIALLFLLLLLCAYLAIITGKDWAEFERYSMNCSNHIAVVASPLFAEFSCRD